MRCRHHLVRVALPVHLALAHQWYPLALVDRLVPECLADPSHLLRRLALVALADLSRPQHLARLG